MEWKNKLVRIILQARIDLAITLIDRIKRLFTSEGLIAFDCEETVIKKIFMH